MSAFGKGFQLVPEQIAFDLPRSPKVALSACWQAARRAGGTPDRASASVEGFRFTVPRPNPGGLMTPNPFSYSVVARERPDGTSHVTVSKDGPPSDPKWDPGAGLPLLVFEASALEEVNRAGPARSIFVSYRHDDSADATGRIRDRLQRRFGPDATFRDVDNIGGGADFRVAVAEALAGARVVLAIIGPKWTGESRNRLTETDDMVRIEIETAFASPAQIVPVLVGGAAMPDRTEVPPSMSPLLDLNALPARSSDFDHDIEQLEARLAAILVSDPGTTR